VIPVLAVHERIGYWGRHLRSRLADRTLRIVETRSTADLERALKGTATPLILIDLGKRVSAGLSDLVSALHVAPDAMVLVTDPQSHKGVSLFAREFGATHILSGPVTPIEVLDVMTRWLSIIQERSKFSGWAASSPDSSESEPWNWLVTHLQTSSTGQRTAGN